MIAHRESSAHNHMSTLWHDVRYGVRVLRRYRGFTILAVAAIATGIGASSAVFAITNGFLLRPLPYSDPARLVMINEDSPQGGTRTWMASSYRDFVDWRDQSRSLAQLSAFYDASFELSGGSTPERISGAVVSANLFTLLGVSPELGRGFVSDDEHARSESSILISHDLWVRAFGADPSVIGRSVRLNGRERSIIGVMPSNFKFPEYAEVWIPITVAVQNSRRDNRYLTVVGRLNGDVTIQQARAELQRIARHLAEAYPATNTDVSVTVRQLHKALQGSDTAMAVLIFQCITALVLAIACANVANLFFTRTLARRKEMALRSALGATRTRLTRQLLVEGLIVGTIGGAIGMALGLLGRSLLIDAIPIQLPFWIHFGFDWRVLAFVVAAALGSVVIFALGPALYTLRPALTPYLKVGGAIASEDRGRQRLQSAFVVSQVATALLLLFVSSLMLQTLLHLQSIELGLDPHDVTTRRIVLPNIRYSNEQQRANFWNAINQRVHGIIGVRSVAIAAELPLTGNSAQEMVTVEGRVPPSKGREPFAATNVVSSDYFRTMGISVRIGRPFEERDGNESMQVAVINETMARRLWPRESPIGARIRLGSDTTSSWLTIVGVADDIRTPTLQQPMLSLVYRPTRQVPPRSAFLMVQSTSSSPRIDAAVREQVAALDPDLALGKPTNMVQIANRALWEPRVYAWTSGVFSGVAILLAAVGVYGVVSYSVQQRTNDIGIRLALGAQRYRIATFVMLRALRLAVVGVFIAVLFALAIVPVLNDSMLFAVRASDAILLFALPLLILSIVMVASAVPALKAVRIDPAAALRK